MALISTWRLCCPPILAGVCAHSLTMTGLSVTPSAIRTLTTARLPFLSLWTRCISVGGQACQMLDEGAGDIRVQRLGQALELGKGELIRTGVGSELWVIDVFGPGDR